jgi:hypothetical protein
LTKQFLRTRPPITKAIRFFRTLSAQNVSTLNWVLFGCSLQLNCYKNKKRFRENKKWDPQGSFSTSFNGKNKCLATVCSIGVKFLPSPLWGRGRGLANHR